MRFLFSSFMAYRQLVLLLPLASCSLNRAFLHPSVMPAGIKTLNVVNSTTHDTIRITYGPNFQPTFSRRTTDTTRDFHVESALFTSSNGNKLNGWMVKPKTGPIRATLLHLHTNSGNILGNFPLIAPLLKEGFQIFLVDYSGFGFSTGQATRENILTDALSAVEYVKLRSDSQRLPLILYGQSLGGNLAAVVATTKQDKLDGLVMEGAFISYKDIAAYKVRQVALLGIIGRLATKEGYSAKKQIPRFKKPLLIIHGVNDEEIPFKMGKRLFELATTPTKTFYTINGEHIAGPKLYTDSIARKIYNLVK